MRERNEMGVKDGRGPDDGVLKIIADDEKARDAFGTPRWTRHQ